MTTDKTNALYEWALEKEEVRKKYAHEEMKSVIVDLEEVVHLKLLACASLDKKVFLWELERGVMKVVIDISVGGVHSMVYSYE